MATLPLRFLCLCLLALAPCVAFAERAAYALDPIHTRVAFAVSHAGFSSALGTVAGSTGTLEFDPEDWSSARVVANVPLGGLELGDAKWNKAALDLLGARRHPVATFVSTRVEPIDATNAKLHGTLTLNGVAREISLDLRFNQLRRHPLPPFRRTVGFSATTVIDRDDFGIDDWPSVIGHEVELRIEAEAVRTRGSVEEALESVPPADVVPAGPPEDAEPPMPVEPEIELEPEPSLDPESNPAPRTS